MRIDSEALQRHLQQGLQPLYTIHGAEPLLALEAGDQLRAAARSKGYGERTVLTVEQGFDWSELTAQSRNLSLFAELRLIELRIPGGKPGTEGAKALERYCAALPPDTVTLIVLPGLERATQQSKWFTALESSGVLVNAQPVARDRIAAWVAGRLGQQSQQAGQETLRFMVDRVEGNLLAAWQEVQKLALLFPPGMLPDEGVREAVLDVARFDVFKVSDAALARDAARLTRMLDGLRQEGEAEPLVLWALADAVRTLLRLRRGLDDGRAPATLMRELRVFDDGRQKLMDRACRRLGRGELEEALRHAGRVDRMIKGLERGDVWDELLQLGLRIAHPGLVASPGQ